MDTITTAPPAGLQLPCTGQALRTALQRRDLRMLQELTRQLRVAGYRFDAVALATALLEHGCSTVADAFGHQVPVYVRVPPRPVPPQPRGERISSGVFIRSLKDAAFLASPGHIHSRGTPTCCPVRWRLPLPPA